MPDYRINRSYFVIAIGCFLVFCAPSAGCSDETDSVPDDVSVIYNVRYRDGTVKYWTLDLAQPKGPVEKLRPAIVVIHGGGWIQGDKSSFSTLKNRPPGNIIDFAKQGFVAVSINYRLADEAPFPAAIHDCKNAVRFLRAHAQEYHIDPDRIGVWGNSAGGHLALMLGMVHDNPRLEGDGSHLDHSSRVQAVVSDSGPIDLLYQHAHNQVRYAIQPFLGGPPEGSRIDDYKLASPINHITRDIPPLLLIYGVQDEQVGVETADQFVVALHQAGLKDVSYHRLGLTGHCPHSLVGVPYLRTVVNDFFKRTLKP